MNTERLSLRGWILLAVAVLAAASWLAAMLGLGGRISSAHADATAATPPLPTLAAAAADAMTAPGSFAAVTERPLFAVDRRPHPFRLGGPEASASGALRLTGVLLAGEFGMATLTSEQNRSLRLRLNGDAVEGWQLLALEPRRATVLGPDGAQVLELAVFDGQGGEPPTVLRDPRDTQAGARPGMPAIGTPPPPPPPRASPRDTPASAAPASAPDARPSQQQGPSEEQMRAIRERIRARREQLQQQQQQRQPEPPSGGAANL